MVSHETLDNVKEKTHTNYNAWQFNLYHHLSDSVEGSAALDRTKRSG